MNLNNFKTNLLNNISSNIKKNFTKKIIPFLNKIFKKIMMMCIKIKLMGTMMGYKYKNKILRQMLKCT